MVLKLYSFNRSSNVHRVLVVIKELGLEYQPIDIDLTKGAQLEPAYKAIQPFGKVPCIDDDGFKLYESRAIARYLAAKAKSPLLPTEPKAVALFEQAASVELNYLGPHAVKIMFEIMFKKNFLKQEPDEKIINECVEALQQTLNVYEDILSKNKYLIGNELTLVDLFHLPHEIMLTLPGIDVANNPSRPNLARWWKDISNRPSWLSVKSSI